MHRPNPARRKVAGCTKILNNCRPLNLHASDARCTFYNVALNPTFAIEDLPCLNALGVVVTQGDVGLCEIDRRLLDSAERDQANGGRLDFNFLGQVGESIVMPNVKTICYISGAVA